MTNKNPKTLWPSTLMAVVISTTMLCSATGVQAASSNGFRIAQTVQEAIQVAQWEKQVTKNPKTLKQSIQNVRNRIIPQWTSTINNFTINDTEQQRFQLLSKDILRQPYRDPFEDIQNHTARSAIISLVSHGIVQWHGSKFHPDNDLRFGALVKVAVNSYRVSIGLPIIADTWSFAEQNGLLQNDITPNTLVWKQSAQVFFQNMYQQYNVFPNTITVQSQRVKRWNLANYVVKSLGLEANENYIQTMLSVQIPDINNHIYETEILQLAQKWIIPSDQGFYPNMKLNRAWLVDMLVPVLALSKWSIQGANSTIADIQQTPRKEYAEYLLQEWIIDYLVVRKRWMVYFYPEQHLTKYEVYKVLEQLGMLPVEYNQIQADTQFMTKWEFASLLVQMFLEQEDEQVVVIQDTPSLARVFTDLKSLVQRL